MIPRADNDSPPKIASGYLPDVGIDSDLLRFTEPHGSGSAAMSLRLRNLICRSRRFFGEEDAATSVEYAFMIVMILGACMLTVGSLARATQENFNESASALDAALP